MRAVFFPAAYDQCIAVGAFDSTGSLADFSNYGPEQELSAPGVGILSTTPGNQMLLHGRHVNGIARGGRVGGAAVLLSSRAEQPPVRAILDASAIDQGSAGRDEYYGYGLVNGFRALSLAQLYGADLEPARALSVPSDLPTVIRSSDLRRLLCPATAFCLMPRVESSRQLSGPEFTSSGRSETIPARQSRSRSSSSSRSRGRLPPSG